MKPISLLAKIGLGKITTLLLAIASITGLVYGCDNSIQQTNYQPIPKCPYSVEEVQYLSQTILQTGELMFSVGVLNEHLVRSLEDQYKKLFQIRDEVMNNSLCLEQDLIVRQTFLEIGLQLHRHR